MATEEEKEDEDEEEEEEKKNEEEEEEKKEKEEKDFFFGFSSCRSSLLPSHPKKRHAVHRLNTGGSSTPRAPVEDILLVGRVDGLLINESGELKYGVVGISEAVLVRV